MTEAFAEHPDYFFENAYLLDSINNQILNRISHNPQAAIAFDLRENAFDTILNQDGLPVHHARMAVERLIVLAAPFQEPAGSIFARSVHPHDTILEIAVLTNTREEPYALRSVTTQKNEEVLDITTITHINGSCTEATRHILPENTELTALIATSIADPSVQAELVSLLHYHTTQDNINDLLAEIFDRGWFAPVSTAESHIARLIQDHIAREREARQFAAQLHIDKPSINDLRQLLRHLQ